MSGQPVTTDYDKVPYPSALFPQTHPDRLATLAALYGMKPASVESGRVLELGCGDGTNVIAMAFANPRAQFHGLDLSARAVERGRQTIQALGLSNVLLHHLDLMAVPADFGSFDFLIAHGLYSWVPAEVRDKIMELGRRLLAEQGVAYISFNAYPGNHLRDLVRRMVRFHTRQFDDPMEKIRQARTLVKFLSEAKPEPGLWQTLLKQQLERMMAYTDAGFYHDDLSPINHPVYFYEFAEHAARHGLQYLSEADPVDMLDDEFPAEVTHRLRPDGPGGLLAREQYLDFLKGRSFRQTLLCRQEIKLDRDLKPDRVRHLLVAGDTRPARSGLDPALAGHEDFLGPKGAVIATPHPIAKAALLELGALWPLPISFSDLLDKARARLNRRSPGAPPSCDQDALDLGKFLLQSFSIGFVELHSQPARFVGHVSDRPVASPLARLQVRRGNTISTLRHLTLKLEDSLSRHLLLLLDGNHDQDALLSELSGLLKSGAATIQRDGQPVADLADALETLQRQLTPSLRHLAQSGVLVG
jgi:methyltransferase-like protein/SAM-dependent methyltransferase